MDPVLRMEHTKGHKRISALPMMKAVDLHKVCSILGLEDSCVGCFNELTDLAAEGLDSRCVDSLEHFYNEQGISISSAVAVLKGGSVTTTHLSRLSPEISQTLLTLGLVTATASYVWASDKDGAKFMTSAHSLLESKRPIDLLVNDIDGTQNSQERVNLVLGRLFAGVYS